MTINDIADSPVNPERATTLLCILDGLGLNPSSVGNAVSQADTPCLDRLLREQPSATLITCGERVGLPAGQMGNSEVGHLNIGAGRVVEQWLLRINRALQGDFLAQSSTYQTFRKNTRDSAALHVIGLFSDGGVHSHRDHLTLLLQRLADDFSGTIYLHLITDGRDTSPHLAAQQVRELTETLRTLPGAEQCRIATVCGRFYAMDRDKRWERTERAFDAVVHGKGNRAADPVAWIEESYKNGTTDEFIEPAVFDYAGVAAGDGVVFWNFRADRMRQIVQTLCVADFDGFERPEPPFTPDHTLAFTDYDPTFDLPFLFQELTITNHLGETVARQGLTQLRVAESEKYPHVTYFFNGGVETPYDGETRRLVPSPREVRTYDEKPEMSAPEITGVVVEAIDSRAFDLIVVNFANCDMVGHTGVLQAAIRAVETVDGCLSTILDSLAKAGGQAVIIADHGNAEQMISDDGTPQTAHTLFPVPVIVVGGPTGLQVAEGGALCDVAPTVLQLMGVPQPTEMTGASLLRLSA
ncbi:MAG: 2,3-bisphosphoglycerate-independent phosphoglycerate mutase [Armatimonadota bacterium]